MEQQHVIGINRDSTRASVTTSQVGLPFSDKKIIPRNTEQDGTDGSSVGILPVSRKRKTSEFCSKPFLGREKPLEFRSKPFSDKKNLGILFQTIFGREKTSEFRSDHFWKRKNLGIPFRTIFGKEETVPNQFLEQKTLKNPFQNIFGNRKHSKKDHFC